MTKPIILHLGDDIKWNHQLYKSLEDQYHIVRSYSANRSEFKQALQEGKYGDFVAIYRPHWGTGGEMGFWDEELISLLPKSIKVYASAGAGFDWVDTKLLAQRGIIYCNSASACTESVADTSIYMILGTFRLFTESSIAARSLDSAKFTEAHIDLPGMTRNPNGHVLGIIGLGRIGLRVAQKANLAFGMKIAYYDVVRAQVDTEISLAAESYDSLEGLLAVSDCVLLATPYGGQTLLGKRQFATMKRGSRFVNIARGKLVDEDALIEALETGHIFAAALDVHFDEPNVNPKLASMSNVELHSHTAGASINSHEGFERMGMENVLSYFKSGIPLSPVNMQRVLGVTE